nr:MAG TPA_asm: hypothetical protein [Caudoviricetes sp.]
MWRTLLAAEQGCCIGKPAVFILLHLQQHRRRQSGLIVVKTAAY